VRDLSLRTITADDVAALAAINDDAVPAVNALGVDGLAAHVPICDLALIAEVDGEIAGFLLALTPGADYASENYRWVSQHRPGSLYIDRIVVAPDHHGTGVGRSLYEAVFDRALALNASAVTCEVNLDPPNPQSLAFHGRLGFEQIDDLWTKGGTTRVAMMARPV